MKTIQYLIHITSQLKTVAKSGEICLARKLFDEMPHRDTIAWNAMITSYCQLGFTHEALKLFSDMRISSTKPDSFTFTAVLSASSDMGNERFGSKIHGLTIKFGYQSSLPVYNSLIDMYGKCSFASNAGKVFEEMVERNKVSWCSLLFAYVKVNDFDSGRRVFEDMPVRVELAWNIMIGGYARNGEIDLCMNLFKQLMISTCKPDMWTFTALMNSSVEVQEIVQGRMIHACIVKSGWNSTVEVNNAVLSFYANLSCVKDAIKIFESTSNPTEVSWNAMIDAHMKVGNVHDAFVLFQRAPKKNIVSWTTMITGYARNGHGEEALIFFVDMMRSGLLRPDDFTLGAVLHACSNLVILGHGKMVHSFVIRFGYHSYAYVSNGLINMYAKCGDIEGSYQAFGDILVKDLVSWNAILLGLGLHGRVSKALKEYQLMLTSRIRPDNVTFIGLLMACSHSGLIAEGQMLFNSMASEHGLTPEADHIACVVDMLSRGGYMREASEFHKQYTKTTTVSSQEAFLGACVAGKGDVGLGEIVAEDLITMDPRKEIGYVSLSNLFCVSGQWEEAEKIRKAMGEQGVKKMPGCSWIEVGNKVMTFLAGTHSQPYMGEICKLLNFLEYEMKNPCLYMSASS